MSEFEIVNLLKNNFWEELPFAVIALVLTMILIVSLIRKKKNFMITKIMVIVLLLSVSIVTLEKSIAIGNAIKSKGWLIENDIVTGYSSRKVPKSNAPRIYVTYFENHQSYRDANLGVGIGESVEFLIVPGYLGTDHIIAINPIEKIEE